MSLTVAIIARNEEELIGEAIKSASFADEIIIFLSPDSNDKTREIGKKLGAKVLPQKGNNFAAWRTNLILAAKSDWIFYLDADERFTKDLAKEVKKMVFGKGAGKIAAYAVPRANYYLGKE
ncbi:MAG: glycosyltransferase [Candidatus Shapirobacteria bacterium]